MSSRDIAEKIGKRPTDWLRFEQSQNFISELSKVRNHTLTDLVNTRLEMIHSPQWRVKDDELKKDFKLDEQRDNLIIREIRLKITNINKQKYATKKRYSIKQSVR